MIEVRAIPRANMQDLADNTQDLKVGRKVSCRVLRNEPGGYAVHVLDQLDAFLHTKQQLHSGDVVIAMVISVNDPILLVGEDLGNDQFVCLHSQRILISARFLNNNSKIAATPNVRWEEYLDEIDEKQAEL